MAKKSNRIGILDEVRGFAIICMVVYHGVYDLVSFLPVDIPFFHSDLMNFIRDVFAFGFLFISGASSHFSRSNLKRGALCFLLGLGMTAVTAVVVPEQLIVFGVLHCLGICMMLFPPVSKGLAKLPKWLGITLLALLYLLTCQIYNGYLGIEGIFSVSLPDSLYQTDWLFWLGFPSASFSSSDYFPLLPWIFAFFLGGYFGRWLKENEIPGWMRKTKLRPLAFVGRHTLWVYLLHQPVLFGITAAISYLIGQPIL